MGFLKSVLTLLFPDRCAVCGRVVKAGDLCCPECEKLRLHGEDVFAIPKEFPQKCVCAFLYRSEAGNAVRRMKFHGDMRAAEYLSISLASVLKETYPDLPWDAITFVPMQPEREKERGYNQSRVMAEMISGILGIPVRDGLLMRSGNFVQHQTSGRQRRRNAYASFYAAQGAKLCGERVLLIDDVLTTGSTAAACAELLTGIGADSVTAAAAAR